MVLSATCTEFKKIWPKRALHIDQREYPDIPARITTIREFDEALLPAKRGQFWHGLLRYGGLTC